MLRLFVPEINSINKPIFEIFEYSGKEGLVISEQAKEFFVLENNIENADWVVIPEFLTTLLTPVGKDLIKKTSQLANSSRKPFGVFSNADLIIDPGVKGVFLFTAGAYSSIPRLMEIPALLPDDPIQKWYQGIWEPWHAEDALVGFCGQATINPAKMLKDSLKIYRLRRDFKKGKSPFLFVPNFLPAWERARILRWLQVSSIKTDFIFRSRYNGGANSPEGKEKLEKEFFQNIRKSLFTVCIRGMGNYSVRFYQTLAMGRIPILIETDSVLPFSSEIAYDQFVLKVPYQNRFDLTPFIASFLNSKSEADLIHIQKMARECWLSNFQVEGMLRNLAIEMRQLSKSHLTAF